MDYHGYDTVALFPLNTYKCCGSGSRGSGTFQAPGSRSGKKSSGNQT